MSNYYAIIDGDGLVFASGFAGEKKKYTLLTEKDEIVFDKKAELNDYVEENELDKVPYEIVTHRTLDPLSHVLHSAGLMVEGILKKLGCSDYTLFLDGGNNYRKAVATSLPYKGNRNKTYRPLYEQDIRDYYIKHHRAIKSNAQEADDECAILHCKQREQGLFTPVIVSIDKDLNMIPGWHYNWKKGGDPYYMNELDSMKIFYEQLLTGDRTDNIEGIPGVGPVKARKLLVDAVTEDEMWDIVLRAYIDYQIATLEKMGIVDNVDMNLHIRKWAKRDAIENGRLLWIRREEGECWFPPGAAREKM